MVHTAVISTGGVDAPSPLTRFGGLSLLKRALLTAQRAGARVCYVLAQNEEAATLQNSLANDPRLTADVVWVAPHSPPPTHLPSGVGYCLVFSCDTLFRPALIQDVEKEGKDGWQVHGGSNHASLAVVPVSQLASLLAARTQEGSLSQEYTERLPVRSPGQHFLYRLTQQDDRGAVERAFLLTLENPRDGLVDTYLNRRYSRPLTRLFLRTPLTPNQITILSFLTGLLGASCFPAWQLWRVGAWGTIASVLDRSGLRGR